MSEAEFRVWCKRNEHVIFVRDKVGDKWDSYSLAELPPEKLEENIARWIKEGRHLGGKADE